MKITWFTWYCIRRIASKGRQFWKFKETASTAETRKRTQERRQGKETRTPSQEILGGWQRVHWWWSLQAGGETIFLLKALWFQLNIRNNIVIYCGYIHPASRGVAAHTAVVLRQLLYVSCFTIPNFKWILLCLYATCRKAQNLVSFLLFSCPKIFPQRLNMSFRYLLETKFHLDTF